VLEVPDGVLPGYPSSQAPYESCWSGKVLDHSIAL
jgi:hypothetical protein